MIKDFQSFEDLNEGKIKKIFTGLLKVDYLIKYYTILDDKKSPLYEYIVRAYDIDEAKELFKSLWYEYAIYTNPKPILKIVSARDMTRFKNKREGIKNKLHLT